MSGGDRSPAGPACGRLAASVRTLAPVRASRAQFTIIARQPVDPRHGMLLPWTTSRPCAPACGTLSGHGPVRAADLLATVPLDTAADRYGVGGVAAELETEVDDRCRKVHSSSWLPSRHGLSAPRMLARELGRRRDGVSV
jgi:hypothetical protein